MFERTRQNRRKARSGKEAGSGSSSSAGKPFEAVYREFYPRVYRHVLSKTGRPDVAQDLAQDVMVAAFKHYGSYDSQRASLSTWIFVIANNRLKNYYRSYDKNTDESLDAKEGFDVPSGERLIEEAAEFAETSRVLEEELSALDEREQAIVRGFFFQGKTNVELADEMQMTSSNVGVVKKRALAKLRLALAMRGLGSGS